MEPVHAKMQQAVALHQQGQLAQARILYEEVLNVQPRHFDALHYLGVIATQTNDHQGAVELIGKAIEINPDDATAYNNRGLALQALLQLDAALASYDKAIAIQPAYAEAYYNRGNVLQGLKQLHAALASYDKAIAIKREYTKAYSNRGGLLQELKQLDAAIASYDKAIAIKPDFAEAYYNRGNAFQELLQIDVAIASYDKAIAIRPDYAEAHWNKSLALLLAEDFDLGWPEHEWRWKNEKCSAFKEKRNFNQPLWLGEEPLIGKAILLHSEQGFGDTIQFCRYVKLVAALGARVILEVQKPLLSLLANLEGVMQLVGKGSALPAFDYHCPLLSLPLACKTNIGTIPVSTKYLKADAAKITQWQVRLGTKTKPRIGLVWSGNALHVNDRNRSIILSDWIKELPAGFQYVSLQKEVRDADKHILQSRTDILNFENALNDFSDTAALCELMDIVISVDTSVAHLAGALGKPTFVLLPYFPDWRWLLDRSDSPWYPSVKLFRQSSMGEWDSVFRNVNKEIALHH
ncbi:MAG TPA: tetratricopeptide repeat-containing glycosyltransferase family protein [Burkholderiaceae bacterium]|jgi:hypothetical protein